MNNHNENFNGEDILDIKSPYIKNNTYSIEEVRERISKRASGLQEKMASNLLSINKDLEKGGSDTLFRQKITNVSKKIVGEEIRKFAEIAGKEISQEFENLEKRLERKNQNQISEKLNYFEQTMYDNLITQNQNLSEVESVLSEKINSNIQRIDSLLSDIENRLKDLEVFSLTEETKINKNIKNQIKDNIDKEEEYTIVITEKKNESGEGQKNKNTIEDMKEILNSSLTQQVQEEHKTKDPKIENYYFGENAREKEEEYITEKLKNVSDNFKKDGMFFKKNIFTSKIKDLNVEEFLNETGESKNINQEDKEKMTNILINLMDSLNIDPKEEENIENFLKRCYQKKYREEN
ncbi:MAG: hypothetical protein U0469_02705 [Candidatus Paceibacterota bacterium]|jgi:hypothetical protein